MENKRSFKGVWFPSEIWLNKEISLTEKALLVEIDSLDNDKTKGCYASNEYLASFVGVSVSRLAHIISDLKKKGYLVQCYFDGKVRGLKMIKPCQKQQSSFVENDKADLLETTKLNDLTYSINNTVTNTRAKREIFGLEIPEEVPEAFIEHIKNWLLLKKEKKQAYKQIGFNGFCKKLITDTNNNPLEAKKRIEYSIAQNYSGVFAEKEKNSEQKEKKNYNHLELTENNKQGLQEAFKPKKSVLG